MALAGSCGFNVSVLRLPLEAAIQSGIDRGLGSADFPNQRPWLCGDIDLLTAPSAAGTVVEAFRARVSGSHLLQPVPRS